MAVAPFLHQCLKLGIVPVRQHDPGGDEQIAGAPAGFGKPLPLRRKVRPLEVFFGIDSSTAPPSVGTRTLPPSTASYSVIGSSTPQIAAVDLEERMRRDADRDQEIAGRDGRARSRPAPSAGSAGRR